MITGRVRVRFNCLAVLTSANDSGQVPGQGKRRRRQEDARQRFAARTAPDPGQWEVVVETPDQAEMRTRLRRLREAGVDRPMIRIDTLCGRLAAATTYRLSRFVTDPARESMHEHSDHCSPSRSATMRWAGGVDRRHRLHGQPAHQHAAGFRRGADGTNGRSEPRTDAPSPQPVPRWAPRRSRLRPPLDQRPLHRLLDQPQPPGTGPRGPNPSRKSAPTWHGTTSCGATRCVTNGSATTPPKPMSCRSTRRSSCTGRSTPLQLCRTAALHIAERRELRDHVGPCPFWFSSISPGARCWTF